VAYTVVWLLASILFLPHDAMLANAHATLRLDLSVTSNATRG